jgi:hypothetical protein
MRKRSAFPTAGGILAIIGSCIAIITGIAGLASATGYYNDFGAYMIMGIFGILAFAFGLTAGILTLKRRVFALAIIGISLLLVSGVITSIAIPYAGWIFGLPIAILSILAIIFTAISKREFA